MTSTNAEAAAAKALDLPPRPKFLRGEILHTVHDGITDDLLTAGAGRSGLAKLTAPDLLKFQDPSRPTPAELRRNAIFSSHLGLIDRTPGAGYGTLYGPGVIDGEPIDDGTDGKIAGHEYLAYGAAAEGGPDAVVTMMVQIPDKFDNDFPCIVTAPSSGSRGIYGAVATVGEWGLQHGCAVVYTDKGTGIGMHDLDRNVAYLIDGEYADADALGPAAHFRAALSEDEAAAFKTLHHRLAFKHAHSGRNAEQHWGEDVLQSIEFAFYVLHLHRARQGITAPLTRANTKVIASSISNGGAASLRAAEQDPKGHWIDAVVVAEPAIQPAHDLKHDQPFSIVYTVTDGQGAKTQKELAFKDHSKPVLDYMSFLNVYQPCLFVAERAKWMQEHGLLAGDTFPAQAADAQKRINDYGILQEQDLLEPLHHALAIPLGVAVTFANAYGRFSVGDNLCGYSFAATDPKSGAVIPVPNSADLPVLGGLFALGNGIPPYPITGIGDPANPANTPQVRIGIVNNDKDLENNVSTTDQNLPGALGLRRLATGDDKATGQPLSAAEQDQHKRIDKGIRKVRASADLRGKPAIIVHGRSDAVIAPNHTSRPYFARNQLVEGRKSRLCYYEVINAHHFDAFNAAPQFATEYISLHYYFVAALSLMYDHLRGRVPSLPKSQVVPTVKRGKDAEGNPLPVQKGTNLPPLDTAPAPKWEIKLDHHKLVIPDPSAA